jgi:hypothetical protein
VYDTFGTGRARGTPIMEYFTNERKLDAYLNRDPGVGALQAGRGEAILTSLRVMSKDPVHLLAGLGIGSVALSPLGDQFTGKYFLKFQPIAFMSATIFILEIGLLGLALTFMLDYLIYRDARAVADADRGLVGALAAGWSGVTVVIVIALFYVSLGASEALSFLFWYFSGVVAAHRMRLTPARLQPPTQIPGIAAKT